MAQLSGVVESNSALELHKRCVWSLPREKAHCTFKFHFVERMMLCWSVDGGYVGSLEAKGCKLGACPDRMSTKMMDCTPEQLPLELKLQLMTLLQCGQNDLDAYIRPGCVHLTVNMSLDQSCGQYVSNLSARAAANDLLQGSGAEFWASRTVLVGIALLLFLLMVAAC